MGIDAFGVKHEEIAFGVWWLGRSRSQSVWVPDLLVSRMNVAIEELDFVSDATGHQAKFVNNIGVTAST